MQQTVRYKVMDENVSIEIHRRLTAFLAIGMSFMVSKLPTGDSVNYAQVIL